jgi:hypothetical protein
MMIAFTIENGVLMYIINVISLFYVLPDKLSYATIIESLGCVSKKLIYIIAYTIFVVWCTNNDYTNECINMIITCLMIYCIISCIHDTAILYSTILYIVSYIVGDVLLFAYNEIIYGISQETMYHIIYTVAIGAPYVNCIAIMCSYAYTFESYIQTHNIQ